MDLDNEDLMSDDDILPEQLKASAKPPIWQMEILEQAINDNTANANVPNLNENDTSTQSCRNSIQVSFCASNNQKLSVYLVDCLSYSICSFYQGKVLIVDERGIVCARHEVLPNGCCRIEQRQTSKNEETLAMARRERYSCKTCNPQGCCTIYEYCVSCCLHPGKVNLSIFYKPALFGRI